MLFCFENDERSMLFGSRVVDGVHGARSVDKIFVMIAAVPIAAQ
jgi:hypothetical protein